MADKQIVRRNLRFLERFPTWQLIIILILLIFVSATFLRLNNIGMAERRQAVIDADKAGDETVIHNRLLHLADYVSRHMNTDKNVVYLEGQYNRDKAELVKQTVGSQDSQAVINDKVDAICKPQFSGYSQGYVECFAREYAKYAPGSVSPVAEVEMPDTSKYRHTFAAPLWSPDFAGFSVLACLLLVVVIVFRLISLWVLKLILKIKYKSV